jgi:ethanolamine utilization protein EutN
MRLARVIGSVVATRKHRTLVGAKLLLTQPVNQEGQPVGGAHLAIDSVGAGVGELVLLVLEGRAAAAALGRRAAPVDAAIVGIVDSAG